jgi:hypothetical protein
LGFALGLSRTAGLGFSIPFAALITAGRVTAYARGIRPSIDYSANRRPRIARFQFLATVLRTIGYTAAALVCSTLIHHIDQAWAFATRCGLLIGAVTGIGITGNPSIEHYADSLPERRLGAFCIGLILCGFALQSVQDWLALLDVRLT